MLGTQHRTAANGTTVAWTELGQGPPLVLLHGLGDSHRTWRRVAPVLSRHFRLLLLDLPGHGFSERPDAPYTLPWYADTIAQWMDAVDIERAHFCGHSYGGGIAQYMLLAHRQRIDRLALVAAGGLGPEVGAPLRLAALPVAGPLLESSWFGAITSFFTRFTLPPLIRDDVEELARLARMNDAPRTGLAFRRTVLGCIGIRGQRLQIWQHIQSIASLPRLALFWGDRDSVLPVRHAHDTVQRLANVTVTIYPSCGHFVHLEAAERLAQDVADFIEDRGRLAAQLRSTSPEVRPPSGRKDATNRRFVPLAVSARSRPSSAPTAALRSPF